MDLNGADSFIANAVGHFLANKMHVPECSCPFRCMHLNAISFGAKGSLYLNAISFGAKGSLYLNAISFDAKEMGRVEIFSLILKRIMNTELTKRSFTNIKHTNNQKENVNKKQ